MSLNLSVICVAAVVVGLAIAEATIDNFAKEEITKKTKNHADATAEINRLFSVNEKGLVSTTINGKTCFIDAKDGLKGAHQYWMNCEP